MRFYDLHKQFKPKFRVYVNYAKWKIADMHPPGKAKNRWLRRMGVDIGRDVFVSPGVIIDPVFPEYIHIRDYAVLGWNARIFAHIVTPYTRKVFKKFMDMHEEGRLKVLDIIVGDNKKFKLILAAGEIWIGDGAFIGGFTTIRAGVRIGEGAIVGSDSLVTKDIPPWKIAFGKPATIRGDVDEEEA